MGFTHDQNVAQFIDPALIAKSAGTWTPTLATNEVYQRRTAADANFALFVPIVIPSNSNNLKGSLLESVELIFNITTAAMDDIATVALKKNVFSAGGVPTASDVSVTIDAANDTAAERKATGNHRMVVTLATPVYIDNDEQFTLYVLVDGSAGGVFDLYGAIANFTARL